MDPSGWIDADAQETLPADCKTPLASEPLVERQGEVPGSEGRRWREVSRLPCARGTARGLNDLARAFLRSGFRRRLFPVQAPYQGEWRPGRPKRPRTRTQPAEEWHCQKSRKQRESGKADGRDRRTTSPFALTCKNHDSSGHISNAATSKRRPAITLEANPAMDSRSRTAPSTMPTTPAATRKPEDLGLGGQEYHCDAYCEGAWPYWACEYWGCWPLTA